MKSQRSAVRLTISLLFSIYSLASVPAALGQTLVPAQPAALKERAVPPKPLRTVLSAGVKPDVIVVKFREGTHIRDGANQLVGDLANISQAEDRLLLRANLWRERIPQQLAQFNNLVPPYAQRYVRRAAAV